jgi:Fe-S cluster biogenesis protein NfuA
MIDKAKVEKALGEVRKMLAAEGGDIELVEVLENGTVKVRLKGACGCCPMSQMTLKMGVEKYLKKEVEGVKEVVNV